MSKFFMHNYSRYNPFVFKQGGPDHPELRSMEEKMKKETEKASKAMKETPHNADEAAEAAKKLVDKIAEETVDTMGWKTEEDLNKPENQPFMARLTEIHVSAYEVIDANLAKYEKHVEAAKAMFRLTTTANETGKAVLDSNYEAFEKLKKKPKDIDSIEMLLAVTEALQNDTQLIQEYGPESMGGRTKAEILTDMNDQVLKFAEYAQEVAEYQVEKLNQKDDELAQLEQQVEAKDPKVSATRIKELWKFAGKINDVVQQLSEIPQLSAVAAKAQQKFESYWARIQKVHQLNVARSPELKQADEDLLKAETELATAQKRVDELANNPKAKEQEKKTADEALDKAKKSYDDALNYFSRLAAIIDEADLAWGDSPSSEMIAAAKKPEQRLEGKERLAVNTAIDDVEEATTVEDIKKAMIHLGTLIAQHGLDDVSIRRRLQEVGFRLPPMSAEAKEFRLVYYNPETGDRFERSVKPLRGPVELDERLADVQKKGIQILNELDTRQAGASLSIEVDGIPVRITKQGHREYKVAGKVIAIKGDETPLYKRIMAVALRRKRVREARVVPGVRYVKAEKTPDQKEA